MYSDKKVNEIRIPVTLTIGHIKQICYLTKYVCISALHHCVEKIISFPMMYHTHIYCIENPDRERRIALHCEQPSYKQTR